jgi:hypothetical protein
VRQCRQSPTWALALGQAAADVVRSQQGACQRTICALEPLLSHSTRLHSPPKFLRCGKDHSTLVGSLGGQSTQT